MPHAAIANRHPWYAVLARRFGSLFWRTFLLIALLVGLSLFTWLQTLQIVQREQRAKQLATQIVSIVALTHAALLYSAPKYRHHLLGDLVNNEGIQIYPKDDTDRITPAVPNNELQRLVYAELQTQLGTDTIIADAVNGMSGVWISFKLDDDDYWVVIDRDRLTHLQGQQLLWWSAAALLLALLGAAFITALVNRPLARLAHAARAIGAGKPVPLLPENGMGEVAEANHSFNQMVHDLEQLEADRAVMLAGISHDLRTPLTRLRLETEMLHIDADIRDAMHTDIEQMDAIIGQFLDYARPNTEHLTPIDLNDLIQDCLQAHTTNPAMHIRYTPVTNMYILADRTNLLRVLDNLLQNAWRYGKTADTQQADIEIVLRTRQQAHSKFIEIEIGDHGAGVPADQLDSLTRPFYRLDQARSDAKGAGLGLAIVQRIVSRMKGELHIQNRLTPESGLIVTLRFNLA